MKAEDLAIYVLAENKRLVTPAIVDIDSLWEFSITQWTYEEILRRINKNPHMDLVDLLEQFINEMDDAICALHGNEFWVDKFITARDTADWVLQQVLV